MSGLIGTLIAVIVMLIVLGVIWWAIQQLLPLIPLGEPFHTIVRVLLVLVAVCIVIWVILMLLSAAGIRVPSPFSGVEPSRTVAAVSEAPARHLHRVLT